MPQPTTVAVFPTSEQRRGFRQWAGPRGVPTLPGNGFAVPVEILGEVPIELIIGAKVNGEVYLPATGQVHHDAPPIELAELADDEPLEVVAGVPQVTADDIPTTGAPFGYEDSP